MRTQILNINCGEESELLLRDPTHLAATGNRRVSYFHEMSHTLWELVSINYENYIMSNKAGNDYTPLIRKK